MSVTNGTCPGNLVVDNKIEFFKQVPSNKPFCHLCRQRVEIVTVLDRTGSTNPLHSCKDCLEERLAAFNVIENQ